MELTLQQRLHRFLLREEDDEHRASRELQAQPVELRVIEGECLEGACYLGREAGSFLFRIDDNPAKFRAGDTVAVGDGHDMELSLPLVYGGYEAGSGHLTFERDPFVRDVTVDLEVGKTYVVDRRALGLRGRLRDVVRAAFSDPHLSTVLNGDHEIGHDEKRKQKALDKLRATGLNDAQAEVGARAIATESLALIQGPPGTGKTRLLAEIVVMLCAAGCRIALCAFTHRAVDNALLAIHKVLRERGENNIVLAKLGQSLGDNEKALRAARVQRVDPRRGRLPESHAVVASTCYQLAKLHDRERFHYTLFDEAGQLPIPHALAGMLRAKRWMLFGDHRQLPPVVTASHRDREASASVFEHLHNRYGSDLLEVSYRMNEGVCRLISDSFYGGRLRPSADAAGRRLPFQSGGRLDEVLDPSRSVVWVRIDHRQPGSRSVEEANAVADIVEDLVRQHGVPPGEIAVLAPFRAQVRQLRSALQHKALPGAEQIVIETIERIQGQEREVVVLSLTVGDPDHSRGRGTFHLNENRLNVAISRARTKAIVVASSHVFTALPRDVDGLRSVSRSRELRDRLVSVDLTDLYVVASGKASPSSGRAVDSSADHALGKIGDEQHQAEGAT